MPNLSLPSAPDLLALAAAYPADFPYLLQSAGAQGWDILFALPESVRVYAADEGRALFDDLAGLPITPQVRDEALPFRGGWFTYLGYEWLQTLEATVASREGDAFPLGLLARVPAAVLVSRDNGRALLVAETDSQLARLQQLIAVAPGFAPHPVVLETLTEDAPDAFLAGVRRSKDYIRDGDVFQVNLSRGWDARLAADVGPLDLYAQLRQANPAPFSAYVDLGDGNAIVSSSPERLVRIDGYGRVETRPIAGTHPRSPDPVEDAAQKSRLIASTKERAEHIMLIDLERNDLGRIAVPGTVKVDALMEVTSYTYVHHIESTVSCQLRDGETVASVLRALFPGGTITGCPKVRCMQIIRELEDRPRRAYTGSLGYINRDGSLDLNILIRTFVQTGDTLYFRAGAGIVADSDPERELNETRAKARGLLRALGQNQ
ncbi:aminodeoxychorismate synthase component I [Chitinimonas sp. BJYL2]|uniref:aminodeoxychorismate synthase component I n=1 Tax=Chitinimonas sp. BJYL2 TaxID=2976696 RepID=UPI0022B5C41E|nr:aminodeoxychorismate synthase component I [Chitinimonas sp. BJYL2]